MIRGIWIGVGLTLVVETTLLCIIIFWRQITSFLKWLFSPFMYPKISLYLIKIGINPWASKISVIALLPDEQFDGWLNILNEKQQKIWKKIRKDFQKYEKYTKKGENL